jgi:hypothetical protein
MTNEPAREIMTVECRCHEGHPLLGVAYDAALHGPEPMIDYVKSAISLLIQKGAINPVCKNCGSPYERWEYVVYQTTQQEVADKGGVPAEGFIKLLKAITHQFNIYEAHRKAQMN